MTAIYILLSVSLFVAVCFLIAFIWCVRKGQYEDTYTPSVRILYDETDERKSAASDSRDCS